MSSIYKYLLRQEAHAGHALCHFQSSTLVYGKQELKLVMRQAFIAEYDGGVRIIVHTANLLLGDCTYKTQGAWVQDFPVKARTTSP